MSLTENSSVTIPAPATTTATVTSPIVNGDNPQPVVTSPVVDNPAPVETPPVDPNAAPSPAPVETKQQDDWAIRRINELTAKRYEAERKAEASAAAEQAIKAQNAELLNQLAAKNNPGPSPSPAPIQLGEQEIERRAQEKAVQMAAAARFNDACNNIVDNGQKEFKDWDEALRNLNLVGAIGQNVSPEFLETAIELKNPHQILHYLGKNLEEAEKVAKLSPKRMAMEMARIEAHLNAPAAPAPAPILSNAPAPVIPVGGAAKPGSKDINDPSISTEEFMMLRAEQKEQKNRRYQRA